MDKQKEIERMKEICELYCMKERLHHAKSRCLGCIGDVGDCARKALYGANYREADEVRKETAREICKYIFDSLDYPNWTYGERCTLLALYKDLAGQYGVEAEETCGHDCYLCDNENCVYLKEGTE